MLSESLSLGAFVAEKTPFETASCKKIKATPASLEKLRWVAKKSELAPPASRCFEQQIFLHATCPCFSAHRPMPTGEGNWNRRSRGIHTLTI